MGNCRIRGLKKIGILGLGLFLSCMVAVNWFTVYADGVEFNDLAKEDHYYEGIVNLFEKNIMTGYEDGTVRPYQELNRAETVKIIVSSFDLGGEVTSGISDDEAESDLAQDFPDVATDAWYYDWIKKAYRAGIIQGYPNGYFYPGALVNRAEVLKMIFLANSKSDFGLLEIDPSNDVSAEDWYAIYLQEGLDRGCIYQDYLGNLNPGASVLRGELADIIYRLKNPGIYSGIVEYGKATFYGKAATGKGTASGEIFDDEAMTAAHRTLPFGTYVRVTNRANGKSVVVRIIDRGPYGEGRIIDLSGGAFSKISELWVGVIDVEVEIVYKGDTYE
ncbi:MAG: rare lipoprotein A, rare lipoprotein A [Candidatus Peregrinibacteria bacterium GW2011_GWE2_39_6]|nr:MAG: rare lipoprotein A, rare lipoprotein A [Candidatus Peregrinibacteria bacterium GW2011_GWF2_39_17]KKR26417.1 MAG: rare lipoprotein A, rare lipoprotein A [Candidatus Peregrinibacteria bacterium GW2011_GWE2_39_6]HCW32168.1 hypothetical protein [Candidatus Peregrinibacteria bacterium]